MIEKEPVTNHRKADTAKSAIDTYVGSRIKLRRSILGISQEKLAEEVGITFQQVQKYERGLNRVSAGRLWKLAKVLGVPVSFFYEDMDENFQSDLPHQLIKPLHLAEDIPVIEENVFARKDVLDLVRYYLLIPDPKVAKNVLDLVKSLSPIQDLPDLPS
ncbi:MAG: helix-turn-helix domain-containing protein, partial [Alphaproteobacteria bacterium]